MALAQAKRLNIREPSSDASFGRPRKAQLTGEQQPQRSATLRPALGGGELANPGGVQEPDNDVDGTQAKKFEAGKGGV